MTPEPSRAECGPCRVPVRRLGLEAFRVCLAGGLFALLANQLSPVGLRLTRDYFPKAPATTNQLAVQQPATNASPEARLHAKGLQTLPREVVVQLFSSPEYASEQVIFVDARSDEHYQAGHIPGAFAFDHYRPETCIATVLPACVAAGRVVVYCTGGDCEDSEFATLALNASGVPRERLFIYPGGLTDWQASGHPVEIGARRSGQFLPAKP